MVHRISKINYHSHIQTKEGDKTKEENKSKQESSYFNFFTLAVSILALLISGYAVFKDEIASGYLKIYQPTGFCIVRGYKDIGFPSDHLIIPLVIENTGKGVKAFQAPILRLKENSGLERVYRMVGTIPDLYRSTLDQSYQIGFSVSIPEKTVREYYLVFHIENWWDTTKPEYYKFQFSGEQQWQVSLTYLINGKEEKWENGANFFTMPVYKTIDNLRFGENYNTDCFSTLY